MRKQAFHSCMADVEALIENALINAHNDGGWFIRLRVSPATKKTYSKGQQREVKFRLKTCLLAVFITRYSIERPVPSQPATR